MVPGEWAHHDVALCFCETTESDGVRSEVATWDYCFLRRRLWPADRLKDVWLGGCQDQLDHWWIWWR